MNTKLHQLPPLSISAPPIGGAFGIQSNICGGVFFAEIVNVLNHFSPVPNLYTPLKCHKIKGFPTFSGGIEM